MSRRDIRALFSYMLTASRSGLSSMQMAHAGRVSDEKKELRELLEDLTFDSAAEMTAAFLREHGEALVTKAPESLVDVEAPINVAQLLLHFPDDS